MANSGLTQDYIIAGALSNVCPDGYKEITAGEPAECEKAAADSNVNANWKPTFSPSTSELPTGCYKNSNNGNAHINTYAGAAYDTFDDSLYDGGGLMHKICKANSGLAAVDACGVCGGDGSSCEQCGDICTRGNGYRGWRQLIKAELYEP